MSRVTNVTDDGLSTASDISYDPYAEIVPDHMTLPTPPPLTLAQHQPVTATTHMPYAAFPSAPPPVQQSTYLSVVHPSGRVAYVPFQEGMTLSGVKDDACRQLGVQDSLQFARVTPLLEDTPVDRQCMPNDVIYMIPNSNKHQEPQQPAPTMYQPEVQSSQPVTPLIPSIPTTPLSASGSFTSAMYGNTVSSYSGTTTPISVPGAQWPMQLEEKLATAANSLLQVISQSRQCTELQQDLETAISRGIDCSAVFQAAERHLPELILHPSGNYLVSKCFELCPSLIDTATSIIAGEVRMYALHKHGSYVVEAILVNPQGSKQSKCELITALLSPPNRVVVATHDSGNFVLQKAIENCPEELLWQLQEAVQSVFHMSTHGPKMLKKLETRIAKSQQPVPPNAPTVATNTLPLPASTVAYINTMQASPVLPQAPSQQLQAPPQDRTECKVPIAKKDHKEVKEAKETWVIDTTKKTTTTITTEKKKELPPFPEGLRAKNFSESWADAEDGPLSPPPMFTEGTGRVPLP